MMEKAEAIRCRRFEQLLNEQFGFLDKEKLRIDFSGILPQEVFQEIPEVEDCLSALL